MVSSTYVSIIIRYIIKLLDIEKYIFALIKITKRVQLKKQTKIDFTEFFHSAWMNAINAGPLKIE